MGITQLFCRHKFNSIRKVEDKIKRVAMPKVEYNQTFQFVTNVPVEFYETTKVTEVFCCEKCGKFKVVIY